MKKIFMGFLLGLKPTALNRVVNNTWRILRLKTNFTDLYFHYDVRRLLVNKFNRILKFPKNKELFKI